MKRTLLALVVLAAASGFAPAKQDEAPRKAPVDRCNSEVIKDIHQKFVASDLEGIAKALGKFGDSTGKIRVPGAGVDRGSDSGNQLCHHAVWFVVDRMHKDFAAKSLGDQLMILTQLNLAFRPLDQAAFEVWEQGDKVFAIAKKLGIAQVHQVPMRPAWARLGLNPSAQPLEQKATSALLTPPAGGDIKKLQSELVGKPEALKVAVLALIAEEDPAKGKELRAGVEAAEFHRRIVKFREALGRFARDQRIGIPAAVVFKSWASATGDNPGEVVRTFDSMGNFVGELAVNDGGFVDGKSYPAVSLDKVDYGVRDQLAVYFKQSKALAVGLQGFIKAAYPQSTTPVKEFIGALEARLKADKEKGEAETAATVKKQRDEAVAGIGTRVQGGLDQFYENTRKGLGDLQDPNAAATVSGVGQEVAGYKDAKFETLKGDNGVTYIQATKGDKIHQVKLEEGTGADPYAASIEKLKEKIIAGEGWGAKLEALKVAAKNVEPKEVGQTIKNEQPSGNLGQAATAPFAKDDAYEKNIAEINAGAAADSAARSGSQEKYKKRLAAANAAFKAEAAGIEKIKDPKIRAKALGEATQRRDSEIAAAKAEFEEAIRVLGSKQVVAAQTKQKREKVIGHAKEIYIDDFKDQFGTVRSEELSKAQAEVGGPIAKKAMGEQVVAIFNAVKAEEAALGEEYWKAVEAAGGKDKLPDPKEYWRKAYQAKLATWGAGSGGKDPVVPPVKADDAGDPNYDPEEKILKEGGQPRPRRVDDWDRSRGGRF